MLSFYGTEHVVILLKGVEMKTVCVLSFVVGFAYFAFGTFCLVAPILLGYNAYLDDTGYLSLDEIGVYAAVSGSILWGASLNAFAVTVKKGKPD
jgi:hypothetical protein